MSKEVLDMHSRQPVHYEGNPNPLVVEACEGLLARARSGEITGTAWATVALDLTASEGFRGDSSRGMAGALLAVANHIVKHHG